MPQNDISNINNKHKAVMTLKPAQIKCFLIDWVNRLDYKLILFLIVSYQLVILKSQCSYHNRLIFNDFKF